VLEFGVPDELASRHFDVVIIGSGPAGVAVAERLYESDPTATIAVIERGPVVLRRHFYDEGRSVDERDQFLARHQECPWDGDLSRGGALLPALGGRGIVGGSQLHRFYECDFTLWSHGLWSIDATELHPYFLEAEQRLLGNARCVGHSQDYACSVLARFKAQHPPCGPPIDIQRAPNAGFPHRSSVQRILALLDRDQLTVSRRLTVFTETNAIQLVASQSRQGRVSHVRCVSSGHPCGSPIEIGGNAFVLAASPVESARLVLMSQLKDTKTSSSPIGRYLSEHVYCRGYLDVSENPELNHSPINIFIPPPGTDLDDRYQIELRSIVQSNGARMLLRVTGAAAMDPRRDNRVTLSSGRTDNYGTPRASTVLTLSRHDERRKLSMLNALHCVASRLGGRWLTPPSIVPCGASYHEAGTLRIARPDQDGAAANDGLLFGTENVFVGDGAAFACVGVANPILTLTAMGYRLADRLTNIRRLM
jgi:GMC oxidoreductase/Lycopene cyclase protein